MNKQNSAARDYANVPLPSTNKNFLHNSGDSITGPFMSAEIPFSLPNATASRDRETWRGVFRPENSLCDVGEHVSVRDVGRSTSLTDGLNLFLARNFVRNTHDTTPH